MRGNDGVVIDSRVAECLCHLLVAHWHPTGGHPKRGVLRRLAVDGGRHARGVDRQNPAGPTLPATDLIAQQQYAIDGRTEVQVVTDVYGGHHDTAFSRDLST